MSRGERVHVILTRDAPEYGDDGELLAGPWVARATVDGVRYGVRGALTRWGAKRALRRRIKRRTTRLDTEIKL